MRKVNDGFTLPELLIAIVIIGLLATIGIPIYKSQVQKAKKSEAKVALGSLLQVERTFYNEFGAYGANLQRVGFELAPAPKYYSVGFPDGDCLGTLNRPDIASAIGSQLNAKNPAYYLDYTEDKAVLRVGTIDKCEASSFDANGQSFTASASGAIASGLGINPPLAQLDLWTINEEAILSNSQDGIQ